MFFRSPKATMPRIFTFRALVMSLLFVVVFAFWLFYAVRIVEDKDTLQYKSLVEFASSLVDALLFIHYAGVLLIELKHIQPQYLVKVSQNS